MKSFSAKNRGESIGLLRSTNYDVIIIGGGITGAGILLDAQLRGLSCCLLEMQDFSEGTSSRSTRLIHGGLRYLKQWNFKLVRETGQERNVVAHIARHLTHPKKVLLPVVKGGTFSKFQLKLALWIYEKLAEVPNSLRHSGYSKDELLEEIPQIRTHDLRGGIEYVEFQTNDSRLTIEVIKTGVEQGGVAVSKVKVIGFLKDNEQKVLGVKAIDLLTNEEFNIKGTSIINATGPWIDELSGDDSTSLNKIIPTKGIHLVFEKSKFPISKAVYFDTPDQRMIFAIPEDGKVYVGTTDTYFEGDISNPEIKNADVEYLLKACNSMFPGIDIQHKDIVSAWSGIRPLIYQKDKKPSEISRKYEIFRDASGVFTIAGGKLTGYRKMAQKIIDQVINDCFNNRDLKWCKTSTYKLNGSIFSNADAYEKSMDDFVMKAQEMNWKVEEAHWVFSHFGSQSDRILSMESPASNLPDYLSKVLYFTLYYELVLTPLDFFSRRTNLMHFHPEIVYRHYEVVAQIIYNYTESSIELQEYENEKLKVITKDLEYLRIQTLEKGQDNQ